VEPTLSRSEMIACFNEWMRQYIEDPRSFDIEFEMINRYLTEQNDGKEPSYGERCTALMFRLREKVHGN
jgi:hypothetical protein